MYSPRSSFFLPSLPIQSTSPPSHVRKRANSKPKMWAFFSTPVCMSVCISTLESHGHPTTYGSIRARDHVNCQARTTKVKIKTHAIRRCARTNPPLSSSSSVVRSTLYYFSVSMSSSLSCWPSCYLLLPDNHSVESLVASQQPHSSSTHYSGFLNMYNLVQNEMACHAGIVVAVSLKREGY